MSGPKKNQDEELEVEEVAEKEDEDEEEEDEYGYLGIEKAWVKRMTMRSHP